MNRINKLMLKHLAMTTMLLSANNTDSMHSDIQIKKDTCVRNCDKKKCKSCKHFRKDNYYSSMCELTYKRKSPLDIACGEYIKRKK